MLGPIQLGVTEILKSVGGKYTEQVQLTKLEKYCNSDMDKCWG